MLAHGAAQFLQFTSLVLFAAPGDDRLRDPVFRDSDWQDLDRLGKNLPGAIRAHYTTVGEPPPETVEAVVVEAGGGDPAAAHPTGGRGPPRAPRASRSRTPRPRRAGGSPPPPPSPA